MLNSVKENPIQSILDLSERLIDENIKLKQQNRQLVILCENLSEDNQCLEEELEDLLDLYLEDADELKQINGLLEEECEELVEQVSYLKEELDELLNDYEERVEYNDDLQPNDEMAMKMLEQFAKMGIYI